MRRFDGARLTALGTLSLLAFTAVAATSVRTGTPPETHYEGAGTLTHGPASCTSFSGDDGTTMFIENIGDFFVGDRVYVSGTVAHNAELCFAHAGLTLEDNEIMALFEGVGTIGWGPQTCLHLMADSGEGFFIRDTGGFLPGSRVYVVAAVQEDSQMCWPRIGTGLINTTVWEFFEGSGTLVFGPQGCTGLLADAGGVFMLENTDGLLPGRRVYVTGLVVEDSDLCWPYVGTSLHDNTIEPLRFYSVAPTIRMEK